MNEYKIYDEYLTFKQKNRELISNALSDCFQHIYGDHIAYTLKNCDFGGLIGFPLFIVAVVWLNTTKSNIPTIVPLAIILALGFITRWFVKHAITIAYKEVFRRKEYYTVLSEYVSSWYAKEASAVKNEPDLKHLRELAIFIEKKIVLESFEY